MSSKVAISGDDIRAAFTVANPTRSEAKNRPDFKLKRFQEVAGMFGQASLCQGSIWNVANETD